MNLAYKPDLDECKEYWRAYWAGEVIDRPAVCLRAWKDPANPPSWPRAVNGVGDTEEIIREYDAWLAGVHWLAEAVPHMNLNFGPDQFAAWVGGELEHSSLEGEGTSWAVPVIRDWDTDAKDSDHPHGAWWERMLEFARRAAEFGEGRFVIGVPDIHSNMDALSALRGPQDLCMDVLESPEKLDTAMATVRRAFTPVFEGLEKAARWDERGYIGWLPFYSEGRFATIQCDYICMISPEHFRRWVLPALEEESSYLDHCCYHLDGPDALVHLDDILAIRGIDAIQWVPGAGNPSSQDWTEVLLKIQKAEKGLYLGASPDGIKAMHKTLRPEGVLYDAWVSSVREADELLAWLKANT